MKEEEKILIEQAKHGDDKAFNQLYERYHRPVSYTHLDVYKRQVIHNSLFNLI